MLMDGWHACPIMASSCSCTFGMRDCHTRARLACCRAAACATPRPSTCRAPAAAARSSTCRRWVGGTRMHACVRHGAHPHVPQHPPSTGRMGHVHGRMLHAFGTHACVHASVGSARSPTRTSVAVTGTYVHRRPAAWRSGCQGRADKHVRHLSAASMPHLSTQPATLEHA